MLRPGILGFFSLMAFFVVVPFGLFRSSRAVPLPLMIAGAVALGLAYGAVKADNPWAGDGLSANLRLMAVSAAALAAYVALSVLVARAIAKRL